MDSYKMISSDSHVVEPPDLWQDRIDPRFKERGPRVVREGDGDYWYVDGLRIFSFHTGTEAGRRFEEPDKLTAVGLWDDVIEGSYVPSAFIKDNEQDGIDASIIYPTAGLGLFTMPDSGLLSAMCRAYNDWLIDFCSAFPRQLLGQAMINVDDVPDAVAELRRCRQQGLVGAMLSVYPGEDQAYDSPVYEPFWAAAQELDMPISFHIGTNRGVEGQPLPFIQVKLSKDIAADYWVRVSLANMIFAGVFERYPHLKVISVEHDLCWAPMLLGRMDYTYTQRHRGVALSRFKDGMMPSDFFHRNVFLSFQEDPVGIRERDLIGVDNLMWGSDYPHQESTFPYSRQVVDRVLEGVPADERRKILRDTTARLYNLD